jgi:hemolysin III
MSSDAAPIRTKPRLRGVVHLVAAIAAVPAMVVLFVHAHTGAGGGAAVYGASLISLLTISAVYHTPFWAPEIRAVLRRVDHAMIYFLIAGSYTPLCLALGGTAANVLLPIVWIGAVLGVLKSIFWVKAPRFLTAAIYVVLGWSAAPYFSDFSTILGPAVMWLLATGGIIYTLGALIYARKRPNPVPRVFGYHEVFHLMVVVAAGCHYAAVWLAVS